jgi:hypothetical protein
MLFHPLTWVDLKYNDDLFNYTRRRFLVDEKDELSQRYVHFNVNELARVAADAVGAQTCISIEKYPDGQFNKAMLLTMDDGTQVVAKIPNPNAGTAHFTIASEVATMDFVSFFSLSCNCWLLPPLPFLIEMGICIYKQTNIGIGLH